MESNRVVLNVAISEWLASTPLLLVANDG